MDAGHRSTAHTIVTYTFAAPANRLGCVVNQDLLEIFECHVGSVLLQWDESRWQNKIHQIYEDTSGLTQQEQSVSALVDIVDSPAQRIGVVGFAEK